MTKAYGRVACGSNLTCACSEYWFSGSEADDCNVFWPEQQGTPLIVWTVFFSCLFVLLLGFVALQVQPALTCRIRASNARKQAVASQSTTRCTRCNTPFMPQGVRTFKLGLKIRYQLHAAESFGSHRELEALLAKQKSLGFRSLRFVLNMHTHTRAHTRAHASRVAGDAMHQRPRRRVAYGPHELHAGRTRPRVLDRLDVPIRAAASLRH